MGEVRNNYFEKSEAEGEERLDMTRPFWSLAHEPLVRNGLAFNLI